MTTSEDESRDESRDESGDESSSRATLGGSLLAAAPDVMAADEHRRRKELVRHRLLGDGPPAVRIGRFTLLKLVGSGAMSVVYAAYDDQLERRVAVKLLRAPLALADGRLRREAQAMARLTHPNVVAVYDVGLWEGRWFIAMELVKGQTLDAWLAATRRSWKAVLDVLLQAGRGLAAAHDLGLVHRDFKPANVMVGEDGRVRVLDFGLVRLAEGAAVSDDDGCPSAPSDAPPADPADAESLTATGACIGTPAYMAPEQRAARIADARSDQFSFCVALHEAIFGVRPGAAPAADGLRREAQVPMGLARVLARGLAADPRARWPSMTHLLAELERLRGSARRRRLWAAALGVVALVAVVALASRHLVAEAQRARAALEQQAEHQRVLAHDARLVVAAQRLISRDPTAAAAALREVRHPDKASAWRSIATAALLEPLSTATIRVPEPGCSRVMFDRDGSLAFAHGFGDKLLVGRVDGSATSISPERASRGVWVLSADGDWAIFQSRPHGTEAVLVRNDGSERRTFGELNERLADTSFTGVGTEIVTVSTEGVVRLWRSGNSQVLRTLRELASRDPSKRVFRLSRTGRFLLGDTLDGAYWIWSTRGTGSPMRIVSSPPHRIRFREFATNERWFVMMLEGGDLELWDLEAGGPPRVFRGHEKTIVGVDFSPDGRWLATASYDGTARIWPLDGSTGSVVLRGHTAGVNSVRFAPDGRRVVTVSRDRTARVWSLDGSHDVMVLRGHASHVLAAAFSRDGHKLVTCGREPSLRIWDVGRRPVRFLGRHDDKIWSARLDSDGRRFATVGFDGTARIWHLDGERPPIVLRGHKSSEVYTAIFSPDGRKLVTGGADGTARIWSADGSGEPQVLAGHAGWVYGIAFSPDGRWLATGSKRGEIRLSPVDGSAPVRLLEAGCEQSSQRPVLNLAFSPSGDRLIADAAGCEGNTKVLWIYGERRRVIMGDSAVVRTHIAISSDGRVVTGHQDGVLRVWSPDGDGPLAILRGHAAEIHDLAFSRDGRRLLSASFDGSARIWDLTHPGEPVILRGHEDWVNQASFDAGERRVVTASADSTARVWLLDEPDQPIVLRGHGDEVRYAGFTPGGRVVTASFDGTVRLWSLDEVAVDAPALMEQLRRVTRVCLTADQRMQYLDEPATAAADRFAACERAAGRAL